MHASPRGWARSVGKQPRAFPTYRDSLFLPPCEIRSRACRCPALFINRRAGPLSFSTRISMPPSLSMSPKAALRPTSRGANALPARLLTFQTVLCHCYGEEGWTEQEDTDGLSGPVPQWSSPPPHAMTDPTPRHCHSPASPADPVQRRVAEARPLAEDISSSPALPSLAYR